MDWVGTVSIGLSSWQHPPRVGSLSRASANHFESEEVPRKRSAVLALRETCTGREKTTGSWHIFDCMGAEGQEIPDSAASRDNRNSFSMISLNKPLGCPIQPWPRYNSLHGAVKRSRLVLGCLKQSSRATGIQWLRISSRCQRLRAHAPGSHQRCKLADFMNPQPLVFWVNLKP